ncbi:MAG: xanthine dehydrogenase accessory protein XdhC [Gammaproteobacteria bacterium]|nr:xanthine dehydrogenase accessory protein XdhC [Gammaproteobacteria bacterium]
MKEILPLIRNYIAADERCMLVTIVEIIGSSPRELGTSMVITEEESDGSIGGGNLEYRAAAQARELLSDASASKWHEELFGLGPALNQCCGGAVKLLFEMIDKDNAAWLDPALSILDDNGECTVVTNLNRKMRYVFDARSRPKLPVNFEVPKYAFSKCNESPNTIQSPASRVISADDCFLVQHLHDTSTDLLLFGAGHVGKAVVQALAPLPFRIQWIDQRAEQIPELIPDNVQIQRADDPVLFAEQLPANSFCLVMTHSHQLDYELCKSILSEPNNIYLGLIGSVTKRRRFEQRLLKDGIARDRLEKLICPIGIAGITDKHPTTIAASVAAQLLLERERRLVNQDTLTMAASA